ncbi:MAG: thermonuclease family protein [Novosphingobium sp.]|nr:thermonuclease family protein [Novosphingobium sp.]
MSNPPPPPPGFRLDQQRKAEGVPPPPPGFSLDKSSKPAPEAITVNRDRTTIPVDGDTMRLLSGGSLRLWGADAPELRQQGWNRQGKPVSIGEMSKRALEEITVNRNPTIGSLQGRSYGRMVAPLTIGNLDVGQSMIRGGNALAAPDFLGSDSNRRYDYLQAERLARQNGLGMHDTYYQPPAEYRRDPQPVIPRETVARFWDTPTPNAGMKAEDEQTYLKLLNDTSVSPEEVDAWARERGFQINVDQLREVREKWAGSGKPITFAYADATRPLTDPGDGATGAAVRGIGNGVLPNLLDELGAVPDSIGLTRGRENIWNSDRRWADIWFNNQQQNASILGYDEMAHPYATLGGELAGGLAVPFGAKAKTATELATVGGIYGGLAGFGAGDGSVTERLPNTVIGSGIGTIGGVAVGKALQAAEPYVAKGWNRLTGNAVSEAPPPPDGYVLDAPQTDVEIATSGERVRDYLDMGAQRPRPVDQPLTEAQLRAAADNISPGDVLPLPSNMVADAEEAAAKDAGRIVEARPVSERGELTRQTVTNYMGQPVPKVGPIDMVGWLRLNGGMADQGGELSHMGLNNASRKGMDFVGQEQRFGPLVNDRGMTLDDAVMRAWEAGYFPDHAERPSVNEFLDALRDTYEGRSRRFLPYDMPEVERFYGAQAERLDLERQMQDGPVFEDRSLPADEQPFPPVQAYEEWPAGGHDFAGNINLAKMESPQDIARALSQTERRVGFDAATRGRVTQAETERLASELGMTPAVLLSRRKGQAFNAEEALAARQILAKSGNELVNAAKRLRALGDDPGSEALADFRQKWMRHVAIQEQVAGATAEAGRALAQFRMAADSRAVRGEVLGSLVSAGGGKHDLQDAANALLDAVELEPGKFNALAKALSKPRWHNKVSELYINFLLSNPPTHVVNTVSNTLTAMAQIPEYATASIIGAGRKALLRDKAKERITASEVGARTFGLVQGAKEGARLFANALRTGDASDFASKVEGEQYKAIAGLKGEIIRIPTRLLTAEDELFKGIARRMELNAQAVRIANREGVKGEALDKRVAELVANPTDEIFERSLDYGRYLTFQRKLGPFGQAISSATGSNLLAKVVVPFVRTPINLMKFATERSPAAPLLKEWRTDFMAGGERRDLAIARMMLGTGFATIIYQAALDGTITGAVPPDPAKARLLYADGWQPYSVKIGDRYVSYSRLDPLSTTVGVAADMATLPSGLSDRQKEDQATILVASIMGNLASKTWLSGASAFVEGLADPGRYAGDWLERTVSAFAVPAGVAGVARAIDPVSRKRESIGDAIKARIPGMSQDLMPRRDVFGEAIQNDSLGPDFVSPFWQSMAKNDPVVAEMLRIEKSLSAPGKQYSEDGERLDYSPEEYDRYHEIAGRLTYNQLLALVGSDEYAKLEDNAKRKAAARAIASARKTARDLIDDPAYSLPAKGVAPNVPNVPSVPRGNSVPPAPPGYRIEGESGGVNVFGKLRDAIPGVRFTSGFRTPEYQAQMRARGYKPAVNSAHLDGSALDMLPPEGKTMAWLRKRVRDLYPDARILIHDGHLHATFPGYFGAPVLGEAKGAGLNNPLEGMPPPPPGFTLDAR